MDTKRHLMFALQSPVGLRFGATIAVGANRISFEIDLNVPKGTQCPFRMELSGSGDTVLGTIRIDRSQTNPNTSLTQYVGHIVDMAPGDRERFDGWRHDSAAGGVSRKLERDPELLKEQTANQTMSGLSESESRAVLDRMNRKRAKLSGKAKEPAVDFGLTEETGGTSPPVGTNIRERLRREAKSKLDAPVPIAPNPVEPIQTQAPVPPSAPAPKRPSVVRPPPAPAPPRPSAPMPTPSTAGPPTPPSILVNATSEPIAISLMYPSHASFLADYRGTLQASAITVQHAALTDLYRPVDVKIQFHDGTFIEVMGQTVAATPSGMAVALAFSSIHHAQMTLLAGD